MSDIEKELEQRGFSLVRGAIDADVLARFRAAAEQAAHDFPREAHGLRNLLGHVPAMAACMAESRLRSLVPAGYVVVRSILFDKNPAANWNVAWHQDQTVALRERHEAEGFGPWTVKDSVPHAQAPAPLLARMLTIRLHLDETGRENGALRVLAGSHRHGRLPDSDAEAFREVAAGSEEILCAAAPGDALLMRPLLFHASSKATAPSHRRVIHLECAPPEALPAPLAWAELVRFDFCVTAPPPPASS
jgi:ectoine hydroxylase-related dioxygenase (phytanoyl-CoA dioxygenase family)